MRSTSGLQRVAVTMGKELSPRTIRICHGVIRQSLEQARKWGMIVRNPALDASPPRSRHHEISPLSVDQVVLLLAAAREVDEDFAVYLLPSRTRSNWLQTKRRTRTALERRQLECVRADNRTLFDNGEFKGRREGHQDSPGRRLTLDEGTLKQLRSHRARDDDRASACEAKIEGRGYIFSSDVEGHRPWRPDVATNRFLRLCKTAGITGVRLHDLRHYVATHLGAVGTPFATISSRLGHRDKATTLNVYQHTLLVHDQESAHRLGTLLDPAKDRGASND